MTEPKRATRAAEPGPRPARDPESATAAGEETESEFDVFWAVLAVVLVAAVIFVGVVARLSMNGVGATATVSRPTPQQTATALPSSRTTVIVQIASNPDRLQAQAAAQQLIDRGLQAKVLRSNDYRPLNSGFYVVYLGPYSATRAGRAEAKRMQARVPGALIRDIEAR